MPGFVWRMEGAGEPGTGNTEAKIGGGSQYVSNLTVWESIEALEAFAWNTVHRQFYARRAEWFEVLGAARPPSGTEGRFGPAGPVARQRALDDIHHWYHSKPVAHPQLVPYITAMHLHDSIVVLDKAQVY